MTSFNDPHLDRVQQKVEGKSTSQFEFRPTNALRDTDLYKDLIGGEMPDTSATGALFKSFSESRTFSRNVADLLAQNVGDKEDVSFWEDYKNALSGRLMWRDLESRDLTIPYYMSPEEMYGDDWQSLNDDDRRERIKQFDANMIDMYYGGVAETASPVAGAVGTLGGLLSDPTTLLPVGATYANAAKIGAGIAGSDVVAHGLATEGKVDMGTFVLATVAGGVLGPAVKYAGDQLSPWLRSKIRRKEPITADEILEQGGPGSTDIFGPPRPTGGPVGTADRILEGDVIRGEVSTFGRADAQKLADEINVQFGLTPQKYLQDQSKIAQKSLSTSPDQKALPAPDKSPDVALFDLRKSAASQQGLSEVELEELVKLDKAYKNQYGDYYFGDKNPNWRYPELTHKPKYDPIKESSRVDVDYQFKYYARPKDVDFTFPALPPKSEQKIIDDAVLKRVNKSESDLVENFSEYIRKSNQSGEAAQWLVRDLAAAGLGGLYGYSQEGDAESAMMWAIGAAGGMHAAGLLGPKLYNAVGRMKPSSAPVTEETANTWGRGYMSYKWTQRPAEYFKDVAGVTGHRFAELVRRMDEDTRAFVAKDMIDVRRMYNKLGIERGSQAYNDVVAALRKPQLLKDAPEDVRKATRFARGRMNNIVEQAIKRGIVSEKTGREMIRRGLEEGYFPRVYDNYFLMKSEGEKAWNEVLSKHDWTKSQIDEAATSILGKDKYSYLNFKPKKDPKTGEIKYTVDKKFIRELYEARNKATFTNRSTHLEKARKIRLPDEVLEPFLINDLDDVLTSYFHDTYKRINGAKYFGKNDEVMHELTQEMKHKGLRSNEINDAWTVFLTAAGDPRSEIIKKMMELPPETRRFFSLMTALQTSRLIFAQTLNLAQATANSLIYLPSRVGASTPKVILRGMRNTLNKQNREWAEEIGAAFETTIMEVAGEMGTLESKYATKFLEYTQFTRVEKWQRQLAANIGKSYAEELLSKKSRLLEKQAKGKLGKDGLSEINKLNSRLDEIGINPRTNPNEIPTQDMNRASQRYSNVVNFVNTPDQLPLFWQDPKTKMFRQFKTFMFHQGAFIHDNVIKPLKKGDMRPILGLAAAGGLGMVPSEIRKWIKADDKDYTMTERYLQGFTAIGGLGLVYDMTQQAAYGEGKLAEAILGPTFGTAAEQVSGAVRSVQEGSLRPSARAAINLPVVAPALDALGAVNQASTAAGYPLDWLPTRKELKEDLKKRSSRSPYSYYQNIYK